MIEALPISTPESGQTKGMSDSGRNLVVGLPSARERIFVVYLLLLLITSPSAPCNLTENYWLVTISPILKDGNRLPIGDPS